MYNKISFIILRRYLSNSSKNQWKSTVGLEVHAQISSNSKLFSASSIEFATAINNNVSLFDSSIPGTLPVCNKRCVEAGVLTALALNCRVNPVSYFDRKHYFYADMPAGYQITQQRLPLASDGFIQFDTWSSGKKQKAHTNNVRLKQLQLEQDSGKSLHETDRSLVDLNRAGIGLMELVFEPDLADGEEAAALVKELILILQRLNTCSCKMEEGALRVDANVSVSNTDQLGVRTEIKNINSVRGVAGAIAYEIKRQTDLLKGGKSVINETRAWDALHKVTVAMRDKEEKQDYRYMPEPNLPPLHIGVDYERPGLICVEEIKRKMPELPDKTRTRLKNDYGLLTEQAAILVNDPALLNMFEAVVKRDNINSKLLANIIANELLTIINKEKIILNDLKINLEHLGELVDLLQNNVINRLTTKILLQEIINANSSLPSKIVREQNLAQITDKEELLKLCRAVADDNPQAVKQYLSGKEKAFFALLGNVAVKSNHRADMALASHILKEYLRNNFK